MANPIKTHRHGSCNWSWYTSAPVMDRTKETTSNIQNHQQHPKPQLRNSGYDDVQVQDEAHSGICKSKEGNFKRASSKRRDRCPVQRDRAYDQALESRSYLRGNHGTWPEDTRHRNGGERVESVCDHGRPISVSFGNLLKVGRYSIIPLAGIETCSMPSA